MKQKILLVNEEILGAILTAGLRLHAKHNRLSDRTTIPNGTKVVSVQYDMPKMRMKLYLQHESYPEHMHGIVTEIIDSSVSDLQFSDDEAIAQDVNERAQKAKEKICDRFWDDERQDMSLEERKRCIDRRQWIAETIAAAFLAQDDEGGPA